MKIFISSTIYDLLDVRAEVFNLLNEMGAAVYLSEIPTSSFTIDFAKSTIETCLVNIKDSDYVILLIDKRYGMTIDKFGYDNISTTHLEYRTAKELNIPILMLVRDRTLGEYSIYSKSPDSFSGDYILSTEIGVFDIIKEHSELKSKTENNWLFQFHNSVDVKQLIRRQLRLTLVKTNLAKNIANGTITILHCTVEAEKIDNSVYLQFVIKCYIENNTKNACFDLKMNWKDDEQAHAEEMFTPGQKTIMSTFLSYDVPTPEFKKYLLLSYKSWDGLRITEILEIVFRIRNMVGTLTFSVAFGKNERKFIVEDQVEFNIEKSV